ncbi:DUF5675 family protein [Reichenbachiella agariperforans]|uniref:DUF5675 family protein n=1 Tax=Reichenbachiella agariperforans TaxID=156994 RepID=UPI0020903F48|nr:DUF5675 family protein [Reichenbachiella agariperforans]
MELILNRQYFDKGTNGKLMYGGGLVCYTIELPWFQNQRNISCIPEGRYELIKRHTAERGKHLRIVYVKGREWILFHAANDAIKELKGCIAPVTMLTGPGTGTSSRLAVNKMETLVFEALAMNQKVFLIIQNEMKMNVIQRLKSPTPKFFKVLRTVGLSLAAAGGAIMASPIALPTGLITLAGYLAVSGGILSAVSQATVDGEKITDTNHG